MAQKAVVIGAGIGGLASAALLAKDGYDVTLLEANDQVGGRAGNWEKDGFRFDTGPSWYLMPEVFDHFYKLMGTSAAEHLELGLLDPGYRVFFEEGKGAAAPIDISAHREKNLELFEQIEPGSREAMEKYLDSAKETYRIAKDYFLYTSFQDLRPLLVGEVLKRVGTLYNLLTKPIWGFASKYVKSHRLRQLLGYPAVFLGSSPYIAPAMFHLMSYLDMEDGVLYAQGGFHRVMESMRDIGIEHGVDLRLNARATEIVTTKRGSAKPTVSGVRYRDAAGETHSVDADIVVSAADLHHSETTFLPPELQTYPEAYWQKKTPGPSAVLMYLGLKGEVPELLHHSLFFTQDWDDNFGRIFSLHPTCFKSFNDHCC
jgi:phytoene desaturase